MRLDLLYDDRLDGRIDASMALRSEAAGLSLEQQRGRATETVADDTFDIWRRKRDSNPRTSHPVNGFQDRRLQPLGHSSDPNYSGIGPPAETEAFWGSAEFVVKHIIGQYFQ